MKKYGHLLKYLKNKYVAVGLLAAVWLLFFDRYSITGQGKIRQKLNELEKDRAYYQKACDDLRDRQAILDSDPSEIEKYAREKFLMKKREEDVFLVKGE